MMTCKIVKVCSRQSNNHGSALLARHGDDSVARGYDKNNTPKRIAAQRLALLQGAMRLPTHFNMVVSDTPSTINTITGTNTLSISNTLA